MSEPSATVESLQAALARERERTRVLREVGLMLDSTLPRDALLERVLAAAARVTEADRATLYLVGSDGVTLQSHVTAGGGGDARFVVRVGEGIAGAAAQERRSVWTSDAYADPRFDSAWDARTGYRTRAVLATPMLTPDGEVVGVVQVLNGRGEAFEADDVALLEALAAQAAVAIASAQQLAAMKAQNAALQQLRGRLERSLRERDLLLEMEQLLSRAETLEEFLDGALAGVMRACDATGGAVLLIDEGRLGLSYRAVRGPGVDGASLRGKPVPADAAALRVASTGEALLLSDGAAGGTSAVPGAPPRTLVVVPVPGEHGTLGVLELRDRRTEPFASDDLALLTLVAANLATGVALAQARRERERSTRLAAVGRTLSNVLHDIRTPMTIISGYAQLMPDTEDRAERARFGAAIVRQFEHIQAMIGELLAFVRGDSQLLLSRVLVARFFTETVELLRRDLAARGVVLRLELQAQGAARFDAAKVTRLVHNLARNAADALAPRGGGTFAIGVALEGDDLVLTFTDDGPGLPDAVRRELFGAFVTDGKPGGTGLGLAIVKRVVDEHQGTLAVDTGVWGTRFVVRLPMHGPPSSVRPPSVPAGVA